MKNKLLIISIIGNTNSGKSTFINTIIDDKISIINKKRNTTKDSIIGILNINNTQLIFHDTPGLHYAKSNDIKDKKLKKNLWESFMISDFVLYFIDISKKKISIDKKIISEIKKEKKIIIVILNKIDRVKKDRILENINEIKTIYNFDEIFPISAKNRIGVNELKNYLSKKAKYGKWIYSKKIKTNKDKYFLSKEITRNSILNNINEEIPYSVDIVNTKWKVVNNNDIVIHQSILIKNIRYKKIIIGKNGKMVKKIRENSQKELTQLLHKKIHLYIQVDIIK